MINLGINADVIHDIRLAIFDKDGTLMDLYNYWSNMIGYRVRFAQERLGFNEDKKRDIIYAMGVDLKRGKLRPEGPVGLKKREIVMQAMIGALAKIGFSDTHDLCLEAFKKADSFSLEHLPKIIKPINGMRRLIDNLYKKGCKIAVATTDKTERAKLAIRFLGISDKINIIVGEDMVSNYKPSPDMVNLILKKLSADRKRAVVVGDAISDVEMGNNAGVVASVGVSSGLTPREKLLERTKYVVDDISKIEIV